MLGMHHDVKRTTDEGSAYLECTRCQRQSFPEPAAGGRVVPY